MEQIDSSQIHLWLAYLDEITDPHLLAEYQSLLREEERQKQARFHFARDRHRYLVTRAMVRTVLSKYVGVPPHDWRFTVNAYGRPSIAVEHVQARGIVFNVSHTRGLVVLGITRDRALGVDVEDVTSGRACLDIADRFLAPQEVRALAALPREQQLGRFFEYWTLKESYIKARGMGLAIPLHRFAFHLDDPARIRLTFDSTFEDVAGRWVFWQLRLGRSHLHAVCAEWDGGALPCLSAPRRWQ